MKTNKVLEYFKKTNKDINTYSRVMALAHWDGAVNMPEEGADARSDMMGFLSSESFKMQTDKRYTDALYYLEEHIDELKDEDKALVKIERKSEDLLLKLTKDEYREFTELTSKAESVWEEAKDTGNFSLYQPYLEKIVALKIKEAKLRGYINDPYDALLDLYEPGMTVEKLDVIFKELKDSILTLLNKIEKSEVKIDNSFVSQEIDIDKQKEYNEYIAQKIGFDFKRGILSESVHPFTTNWSNRDVRITTKYNKDNFVDTLLSTIHEAGHAIYEMGIDDNLDGYSVGGGVSMGIHESQSRFYENFIGRSRSFWKNEYENLKNKTGALKNIPLEDFYKGINKVTPGLIRVEADELTYSLHIIIRYEIEKDLINERIKVSDLPKVWNKKYKEYLGIEPKNDGEGVLQDVHWSDGSFGYFPSYALGNLYNSQFTELGIKKAFSNFDEMLERGDLLPIKEYLRENIHRFGATYEPSILIEKMTGEELTSKYFIKYLKEKYSEIYNLK